MDDKNGSNFFRGSSSNNGGNDNDNDDNHDLGGKLLNWKLTYPENDRQRALQDFLTSASSLSLQSAQPLSCQYPVLPQQPGFQDYSPRLINNSNPSTSCLESQPMLYYPRQTSNSHFAHRSYDSYLPSSSNSYANRSAVMNSSHNSNNYPTQYAHAQFHQDNRSSTRYNTRPVSNHIGSSSGSPNPDDDGWSTFGAGNYQQNSRWGFGTNNYHNNYRNNNNNVDGLTRDSRYSYQDSVNRLDQKIQRRPQLQNSLRGKAIELTSLDQIIGRIALAARNQKQCIFLINRLGIRDPQEIETIFSEVKRDLCLLALHQFGNYVVQMLIGVVDEDKFDQIYSLIVTVNNRRLRNTCLDDYGNKVIVALIERLEGDHIRQSWLIKNLREFTVALTNSSNCRQFLYTLLISCPYALLEPLFREIAANFIEIATDKNGCCVLQSCLDVCYKQSGAVSSVFNSCVSDVIDNANYLSESPSGNYVVQCVIQLQDPQINRNIVVALRGRFVSLSMNKHASNVVEKLITSSEIHIAEEIITEIAEAPHLLHLLQDMFGNYVAQTAIRIAEFNELNVLEIFMTFIEKVNNSLVNHPHGRSIALWYKRKVGNKKENTSTQSGSSSGGHSQA